MKLFDLSGRVAIVTGGNGGIGLGMARGLGQAGAAVVVAGRQAAKSRAAVKELEALGAQAAAVEVDVRREASVRAMVEAAVQRFGRLDILVCNAGTNIRKLPHEYTLEEWHTVLERAVEGPESLYRGHEGLRRLWHFYRTELDRFEIDALEIRDVDEERVLLLGRFRWSGSANVSGGTRRRRKPAKRCTRTYPACGNACVMRVRTVGCSDPLRRAVIE